MASLPPLDELNRLPEQEFFAVVNTLFETAPPLSAGLKKSIPFRSYEELIDQANEIISNLSFQDKIEVINAHPRIGTNPNTEKLSPLSYQEQGIEMDAKMEKDRVERIYRRLGELNEQYENKFGFKFVVFVNGRTKEQIIPVLEERLNRSREEELQEGLQAMLDIARDRLKKLSIKSML